MTKDVSKLFNEYGIYKRTPEEWKKSYDIYKNKMIQLQEDTLGYTKPINSFSAFKRNYSRVILTQISHKKPITNILRTYIKQQAIITGPRANALYQSAKHFIKGMYENLPQYRQEIEKFKYLKARDFRINSLLAQEYIRLFKDDNKLLKQKYKTDAGVSDFIYDKVDYGEYNETAKNKKSSKTISPGSQFAKLLEGF